MCSVPVRKKPYYLNPLENLGDLLYYICGALKREPVKSASGLTVAVGTLNARFERTVDGTHIREVLDIHKDWGPHVVEQIVCSLEYKEPKAYEDSCKEEKKKNPIPDRFYRDFMEMRGKNRYLSYEMFIDSARFMQWMGCQLSYRTTNLGRGLSTLARLKINPEETIVEGDATLFQSLYNEMETKAQGQLAGQIGQDRTKWKRALRRQVIDIPIGFRRKFERASPAALLRD